MSRRGVANADSRACLAGFPLPLISQGTIKADWQMTTRGASLKGQRFGKGVVTESRGRNSRSEHLWELKCDCGNKYVATRSNLVSRNTKSCGCLPKKIPEDLTDKVFHSLTARKMLEERDEDGKVLWLCDCECGGTAIVRANSLK